MPRPAYNLFLAAAVTAAVTAPNCPAQAFEVTFIKVNRSGAMNSGFKRFTGGMLNATNITLKMLIAFAYDIPEDRVHGGPAWLDSERYDIIAKPDRSPEGGNGKAVDRSVSMIRRRTQGLLADRFQLAIRTETRQLPIFNLVVANGGPKNLQPPKGTIPDLINNGHKVTCQKASMEFFAKVFLTDQVGRPVVDKTGIQGDFDFTLEWTPDAAPPRTPAETVAERGAPDPLGPGLFTALPLQLGLKLETSKGPVEILLVDRAEKAKEN